MAVLENICIHHSGPANNDPFSSSFELTQSDINQAHKQRWNFKSSLGYYGGYNFFYDQKDGTLTQFRALGEETAAQRGYNLNTISICIGGNFNRKELTPVDPLLERTKRDVTSLIVKLIDGDYGGVSVAPDTTFNLSVSRIYPHRFFVNTECYGTFLDDGLFRKRVSEAYYKRFSSFMNTFHWLQDNFVKLIVGVQLGSSRDRDCGV